MTLNEFNHQPADKAKELLATACGSAHWQTQMMQSFPFADEAALVKRAMEVWYHGCSRQDWLEAFSQHPKIGDLQSLAEKFPATRHLAGGEQESVQAASPDVITQLSRANDLYEAKFGFIFIVFATGKSAEEMLRLLQDRSPNNYEEELIIAMGEQLKITLQRFKKIITQGNWQQVASSQLSTHVLDTNLGKPAASLSIRLMHFVNNAWYTLAQGVSNNDGRLGDMLPAEKKVLPGNYKMVFFTAPYFEAQSITGFYPKVEIDFTVFDDSHYHIPLLLSPFGYSTYRGS